MVRQTLHCYAVRQLNPFRGVVQIAATAGGRAISLDGCHWEIQIKAPRPDDLWGAPATGEPITQYLRFGIWSNAIGMRRIPAHPLLDLTAMISEAEALIHLLQQRQQHLPFPLEDRFELWLLDGRDRMPLALLASGRDATELVAPTPLRWRCCEINGDDFESPGTDRRQPKHPSDTDRHPHMHMLESLLRHESGNTLAQWFERHENGDGTGRPTKGFDQLTGRVLPAGDFPELLLREHWPDHRNSELVADYLNWLAPRLLALQTINDDTRGRLEQQARKQALLLAKTWPLYPKIIDQASIDSARIEAKLRRANRV